MNDNLQLLIGATIVVAVFFAVWKHGRGNPESTGHLGRQLRKHGETVAALEQKLEGCATRSAVDLLAEQVRNLQAGSASSGEVLALEMKINGLSETLNAKIDGVRRSAERTEAAVTRIEGYFLQRGVKGQ